MTSAIADAASAERQPAPPRHLQLDDVQWALFTACIAHVGANHRLGRIMARSGGALRAAGISSPELLGLHHDVSGFDCGEQVLNGALQTIAKAGAEGAPLKTQAFVIALGRQVVGYYALQNGSVSRIGGQESERIPVEVLRHFAVDRRWANREIASDLWLYLVRKAHDRARASSTRGLIGYPISRPVNRLWLARGSRPLPKLVHVRAAITTFAEVESVLRGRQDTLVPDTGGGSLSTSAYVVQSKRFVAAQASDRFLLLNIDSGKHVELGGVGGSIWPLIAEPTRIDAICARLQSDFDVDAATCEREILTLLADMRGEGIIVAMDHVGSR